MTFHTAAAALLIALIAGHVLPMAALKAAHDATQCPTTRC